MWLQIQKYLQFRHLIFSAKSFTHFVQTKQLERDIEGTKTGSFQSNCEVDTHCFTRGTTKMEKTNKVMH